LIVLMVTVLLTSTVSLLSNFAPCSFTVISERKRRVSWATPDKLQKLCSSRKFREIGRVEIFRICREFYKEFCTFFCRSVQLWLNKYNVMMLPTF